MSATKNHRGRNLAIAAIVIVAIAATFGVRFRQLGQSEALASIRSVQEDEGMPVEAVRAERTGLSEWITLAGTVEGEVQYPVVSQNSLAVVEIAVHEGQQVAAGDLILRLASSAPSPMYHSLGTARASYEQALVDVQRLRNLFAEGAVSQADLDAAETALKIRESGLNDAEGTTALRASEAGVVSSILVDEGETVGVGKPLVWILDTRHVKVRFTAGSDQARALATGQKVQVAGDRSDDGRGTITKLDLMADSRTHLLEGEASLPNEEGHHVPGLLVSLRAQTVDRPLALTVPHECVVSTDDGNAVWTLVREEGVPRAHLQRVTTGARNRQRIEILSGLDADAEVVRFGQSLLSEAIPVKIITREEGN